jgi:predicted nuclease of predicted toxin-antitoxin system
MKFLADMGVSMTVIQTLRQNGYDAVHLREEGLQRLADSEIVLKARLEERIVLTFDLDFGDLLAASADILPSVIIFRLQNTKPSFVASRLLEVLSECGQDLTAGAILTVQDNRYRLRRLPI